MGSLELKMIKNENIFTKWSRKKALTTIDIFTSLQLVDSFFFGNHARQEPDLSITSHQPSSDEMRWIMGLLVLVAIHFVLAFKIDFFKGRHIVRACSLVDEKFRC